MKETVREMNCPCKGKECDGGYGWKWSSSDLGNQINVGGQRLKAGQMWVDVCKGWTSSEAPPDPPGISNIQRYKADSKETPHGFHKRSSSAGVGGDGHPSQVE